MKEARGLFLSGQPRPVEGERINEHADPGNHPEPADDSAEVLPQPDDSAEPESAPSEDEHSERVAQPFVPRLVLPDEAPMPGYQTIEERLLARITELTQALKQPGPPRLPESDPGYAERDAERVVFLKRQKELLAERARVHSELLASRGTKLAKAPKERDGGQVVDRPSTWMRSRRETPTD